MRSRVWLRVAVLAPLFAAPSAVSAAIVNGVRVWSGPDGTRVVFELSGPVEHRVFALSDPDRLVVDLPSSSARAPLSLPEPRGVVTGLRSAVQPGGVLRVVLELSRAAKPKTFLLAPNEQYGHRLVVDLTGSEVSPTVTQQRTPPPVTARGRDVVIAIDAGHGGEDPGATGRNGAREKDVVLSIARRSRGRGQRAARVARRADPRWRLLRLAPQAHGDCAQSLGRLLHIYSRRLVS